MARLNWSRDELILALDLYFKEPAARGNSAHARVHDMSDLLNRLPIHGRDSRRELFRNANGVAMKLSNFLRFDPSYPGAGLPRGNRLEEEVWLEFAHDRERLARVAERIERAAASAGLHSQESVAQEDEFAEAPEGQILTRLHQIRERSRKLVSQKKRSVLAKTGRLECEACGFDFERIYGDRGAGFAECPHTVPIADLSPDSSTRLDDLAIVCANCHRMIHRRRPWLSVSEVRDMVMAVAEPELH
jgi:5-methylcytosine-specific restriction enzyme A